MWHDRDVELEHDLVWNDRDRETDHRQLERASKSRTQTGAERLKLSRVERRDFQIDPDLRSIPMPYDLRFQDP